MSRNPEAATPADEQNFLNRTFERVGKHGLDVDTSSRTLSHVYQGLVGISVISQILIANDVANGSCGPALDDYLAGGLLDAVNALSSLMVNEIDRLADHAECRAKGGEVSNG
ncbi:hypothetical protein [Burkholderia seminalis]|uniref:hypothetical protein n=1 Tax=Burkholderia seminalis TaxID=488731 RepID=UPI00264F54AF|nr:hypothetical protein [Burkholderia seminalis]MDN7592370.1 hypothetical protein [Burkholderia seminalis]